VSCPCLLCAVASTWFYTSVCVLIILVCRGILCCFFYFSFELSYVTALAVGHFCIKPNVHRCIRLSTGLLQLLESPWILKSRFPGLEIPGIWPRSLKVTESPWKWPSFLTIFQCCVLQLKDCQLPTEPIQSQLATDSCNVRFTQKVC